MIVAVSVTVIVDACFGFSIFFFWLLRCGEGGIELTVEVVVVVVVVIVVVGSAVTVTVVEDVGVTVLLAVQ